MPTFDPIQVEVWRHLFASIAEEMGAALERTGFSPNIKERRDHSCALFDAEGRLLAQAAHIPVHLGAMPLMMERLRHEVPWRPGSMWLCNDPQHGGTHLPDLTLVMPVFDERARGRAGERANPESERRSEVRGPKSAAGSHDSRLTTHDSALLGFTANRAHHADIGGMAPGSLPLSTELFHEGLIIPPVRLVAGGRLREDVAALVCANSRTPRERRGDLAAQVAANRTGARRLQELFARYGEEEVKRRAEEARRYSQAAIRRTLAQGLEGVYSHEELLDDDGLGHVDLPIRVTVTLRDGRVTFDFTGTAPETEGSVNATEAVARSACYYVVRCLVGEEIPMNEGAFAPVEVIAPPGTLVNARFPRAVAAGNVETSQRIVDALLGALAPAFPNRIPACSQGTMNNVTIGGLDPFRGGGFAYYETICGGAGGSSDAPGAHAVHTHMTNTRNTPIEALEMHYPLRVREYRLREGSGGAGEHPGGDGVVRSMELLAPARVSLLTERRRHAPPGLGGGPGAPGVNRLLTADGGESALPPKASLSCEAGSVVTIETPGGGGWSRRHVDRPRSLAFIRGQHPRLAVAAQVPADHID